MKFADVIGQQEMKAMLRKSIDEGRVSHAQLFSGQSGCGALPLALAYVQYLNCTDRRGGDSCGACPGCVKTAGLVHPDLHFIYPSNAPKGSGGSSQKPLGDTYLPQWRGLMADSGGYFDEQMWYDALGLENQQGIISKREADEIIRKLAFKPFESKYKSVIIWLPEKMNDEAANSLLKILEEPWENTLFLLVSANPRKLLPTILSRTQEVAIPLVGADALEVMLRGMGADGGKADTLARLANGNVLEARRLMSDIAGEGTHDNFGYFTSLMRFSYNDRHLELLGWAETMASLGRENQKRFFEYTAGMLRESYMLSAGMENISYLWGEEKQFSDKFSLFIGNHNIEGLIRENELALMHIAQNGNPKIIFAHYALTISKMIGKG